MFPNELIPGTGIDLYMILICVAAVSAILIFRVLADKRGLGAELQNLCIFTGAGAIIVGYLSAVLFQALYNIGPRGGFEITSNTGATFYGGLIGGAAFFLLVYFVAGHFRFFETDEHKKYFFDVADIGSCSIVLAHAIGRLGCLAAGCCHGARTDAWFGIEIQYLGYKVIPTQLFEAIFLFLLFGYLLLRVFNKETYCLPIYMAVYGVWRFLAEYMRDDYRGTTFVSFLTPSQLTAILMVLGGVALFFFQRAWLRRSKNEEETEESEESEVSEEA